MEPHACCPCLSVWAEADGSKRELVCCVLMCSIPVLHPSVLYPTAAKRAQPRQDRSHRTLGPQHWQRADAAVKEGESREMIHMLVLQGTSL